MSPPEIFEGQPRIVSLLILISYCIFGPYMDDSVDDVPRPIFPKNELSKLFIVFLFTTVFCVFAFSSIYSILLSLILTIAITPSATSSFFISIYQRRAPSVIRRRCKQKPSCSEYMKLSINKYGWLKGVKLGWIRLTKCNGDEKDDFP